MIDSILLISTVQTHFCSPRGTLIQSLVYTISSQIRFSVNFIISSIIRKVSVPKI